MNDFAQTAGDFQTKNATGNWSDFNAWNIRNAGNTAWISAVAGQIPTSTSSVFVQAGQIISVDDANAVCNDLNINGATTSKIAFSAAAGILNVKGNMILFSAGHNCFGAWQAGAKIVFSGTGTQEFTNLSVNSAFVNIEVNKPSGTLSTSSNLRFGSFTLTAGNFTVGSGNEIQGTSATATININGGVWTQINSTTKIYNSALGNTSPIGTVTINGGMMVLATSTGTGGFQFSTINITNSGTLTLNNFNGNITIGTSLNVDATGTFNTALTSLTLPSSVTFNGVVNYNHAGVQTINAAIYSYLKLSGTSVKSLGGSISIPANGTLEMSGVATSPTLNFVGNTLSVSPVSTTLIYSSAANQTASAEWDDSFQNVTVNSGATVSMTGLTKTINGTLTLNSGTLNIGTGGSLSLNGPLVSTSGFMDGTNTSNLNITGTTGSTVLLPLSGNISLRNLTVSGTRTLLMNGLYNISLNGLFNIGPTAAYDNGGESQIINGGGSIIINGKFINRDKDNFTGINGAISAGVITTLNNGSTIEYGLAGNQLVTSRSDYQNIIFSGSGTKTIANSFAPLSVNITGSAIVYAGHNFGDNGTLPYTNFTMDGGRLILATIGTQPCMTGNYTLTGGIVEFANSQLTGQSIRSKSYQNIEVTGNNVGNSNSNVSLNANGTFTVKTGGVFEINDNNITGPAGIQTVTVENGAIFRSGNNEGFNGFISTLTNNSSIHQNIENIILNPGSTVEYMRNGDQPVTNTNGLIYSHLLISGTGNKTAPSGILNVQGNLIKSGTSTFAHNGGTVLLDGAGTQNFAGLTYNNLILSNNIKTTAGNSTIIDSIKVSAATTLSVSSSDIITLHSDATKTARMAQVDGSINYNSTGKFVVERYIPARRSWRFLSIPTNTMQTIKQAWQEGALNSGSDPVPGYGTQITSNRTSWLADGFDVFSAGGPSMKTYNPVTNSYDGITNTFIPFSPGHGGYMTFIRGDRTATAITSPVTATVLRTAGTLYAGPQTPITVIPGQITPYQNPYASPIDLRKISQSPSVFFYVWDPNRGGNYGFGAFQTLFWNSGIGSYDVVPGGGSYAPGGTTNFIESGQAFLVSGSGVTLAVAENIKANGSGAMVFEPVHEPQPQLRINLYAVNPDGSSFLADGVLNHFGNNHNNDIDEHDAIKSFNTGENLSIKSGGKLLTIERKHTITNKDTIFLNLTGVKMQQYQFHFEATNLNTGIEGFLEDNYMHSLTPISLKGSTSVSFNIENIAGSNAPDRFRLVFSTLKGLPVIFTSIKGYQHGPHINIEWKVDNEINMRQYHIEKSTNGFLFTSIGIKEVAANNAASSVYFFEDKNPVDGYNYYRIKSIDINGKTEYTNVIKVFINNMKQEISIFPNPVTDGMINLVFTNQPEGKYGIRLLNKKGQVILSRLIKHTKGNAAEAIKWNNKPVHGLYYLEIKKPDGDTKSINVMY